MWECGKGGVADRGRAVSRIPGTQTGAEVIGSPPTRVRLIFSGPRRDPLTGPAELPDPDVATPEEERTRGCTTFCATDC